MMTKRGYEQKAQKTPALTSMIQTIKGYFKWVHLKYGFSGLCE